MYNINKYPDLYLFKDVSEYKGTYIILSFISTYTCTCIYKCKYSVLHDA